MGCQTQGPALGGVGRQVVGVGVLCRTWSTTRLRGGPARPLPPEPVPPALALQPHPPWRSTVTCLPSAPLFSFIPLQVSCLLPTSREALLLCKQNMSCLPGKMGCLERFPADCCAHIAAQDSCKRQSQRVALPAGEEPCPLRDLGLIIPCGPSCSPSLLPAEGLVLPTGGQARQGGNRIPWWWQGTDRCCKVGACSCLSPHWPPDPLTR